MEAQEVTWLVFLALTKHVSTSDPGSPVKYPPTEPKLSMRSEVTEGQTITTNCTAESFPKSTLTLMKINTNNQAEIIPENNINSRPINSLSHTFTVTSADAGLYSCRAQNTEGSKDSKWKELVVKYPPTEPKLSMRSEVTEGNYLENLRFLVVALLLLMIISVIVVNLRYWRKSVQQGTTNTKSPSGFSNEPESLQDYENISNAAARAPTSSNLFDDHTSEGEVELNFPQVRFTATPRRQTTNRDSSSSHQDES
ncbi:uncharacterized protein LOC128450155 isoform X2 [Pleuronectes platessa]|uniref:uncharacterized protein LOC128450155 isoform X2 n=1 Tax=Pleuronectes platessa TaxID=8262 RepID=UPI00232A6BEA|nr:uncharacterized protein LOC128450155 isoform X2 [Pleuronectes platessa]